MVRGSVVRHALSVLVSRQYKANDINRGCAVSIYIIYCS